MNLEIAKRENYRIDMKEGNLKLIDRRFKFSIDCKNDEYELFKNLLEKFFTIQEIEDHKFKINLIETLDLDIPESILCNLCKQKIGDQDITYTCSKCNIFFCHDCVKAKRNKQGFQRLVHKDHYLIVFKNAKKENLKNIETFKLGKDLFASYKEDELSNDHRFICDSCGSEESRERYVCLNCEPGAMWDGGLCDYCQNCFELLFEKGNELTGNSMHNNSHVLLHMVYAGDDYLDY